MIQYALEPQLEAREFIDLLHRSTLAARRPIHEPATIHRMLKNADIIATARLDGLLVGVSRALSDFAYCTYLSDLAVDAAHQRTGIGRELVKRTHQAAGPQTSLILIAAPAAEGYYPKIGMQPHPSCWIVRGRPLQTPPDRPTMSGQ